MKKLLMITLLGVFGLAFISCGQTPTTQSTTTAGQQTTSAMTTGSQTTASTSEETTTTADLCTVDPFDPSCINQGNIVLSYADWGDPEMNQALIDAFMEKYPNITVSLRSDFTGLAGGAFTEALLERQIAGTLPDVFAIDNVPTGAYAGMLMDVAPYWDMDPDTELVYPNIAQTALYNGKRLAIPSFQFIKGIFLNMTVFDHYNIDLPDYDWTYEEFLDIAVELRQAGQNDHVYAIDPLPWGTIDFESIFPTQDDADVGYNTWDGERFNFNTPAWINAFNLRNDAYAQNLITGSGGDDWESLGVGWPWYEGYVGMKIDGSWDMGFVDTMLTDYGQEVGFWPYPGGSAGQFPPVILDFQCVSSQTTHPLEAYLLAKWMTFGREGWLTRLSVMEENEALYLDRYPVANYPEVWAAAEDFLWIVDGLQQNIDLLEYSKPDVDKWLPGYKSFWEWVADPNQDYWTLIDEGSISPEVFAPEWEAQINQMVSEALATIGLDEE